MTMKLSRFGFFFALLASISLWSGFASAAPGMSVSVVLTSTQDNDNSSTVTEGDQLFYTTTATNTGTVPLTNVQVNDSFAFTGSACANLPVASTCILTDSHVVQTADATAGTVANTGTATSTEVPGPITFTLNTPVFASSNGRLALAEMQPTNADGDHSGTVTVGDVLTYTITARNDGAIALTNVQINDPVLTPGTVTCASVAINGTCVLSGTHTVTPTDAANGQIFDNPRATATETGSAGFDTGFLTPVATAGGAAMAVGTTLNNFIDTDSSNTNTAGDQLHVVVTAVNAGSIPLTNVVVSELQTVPNSTTCASVAVGATCVLTGLYTLTAADVLPNAQTTFTGSATSAEVPGPVSLTTQGSFGNGGSINLFGMLIVAGDAQGGAPGTTLPTPLKIRLLGAASAPISGKAILFQVVSGSGQLTSNIVTTDALGEASTQLALGTTPGPVNVYVRPDRNDGPSVLFTENVTGLAAPVVIATLPNLTPEQTAVAVSLDNACPALAALSSPTPEQADLLARCRDIFASAGVNPTATANALEALLSKTEQAQTNAATLAIDAQIQNIQSRLLALRSGTAATKSNGLSITGSGGVIPFTSLMNAFMDEAGSQPADAGFSRWGFFATGNIGRGEARANSSSPAYDYDINGITAGIDYRQRDNWISGAALGYTRQDTNLANDAGKVALSGWSFSGYSTYSFKQQWYLDGVVTYGRNRLTLERAIRYTLPLPGGGSTSIDQLATGKPNAKLFSSALTFGGDFHREAWGLSPYSQVIYSRVDFASYHETLHTGPGAGLGLAVDARRITSLTGILGARLSYTRSANWGVFAPTASLEWNHEFRSDPSATTARFIYDPTQTPFSVSGQPLDSDYFRLGLGMTLLFTHGRSGFFLYQRTIARSGQSQSNLSLGIRIEF